MTREQFKKLLPTVEEIEQAAKDKKLNELSPVFVRGAMWALLDYTLPKFPDFTEVEMEAIEMYKESPLSAALFLKNRTKKSLNEAREFLQKNQTT